MQLAPEMTSEGFQLLFPIGPQEESGPVGPRGPPVPKQLQGSICHRNLRETNPSTFSNSRIHT